MDRRKRYSCELWDMSRFRRCEVTMHRTLRRVVFRLLAVSDSLAEPMLRVMDLRNSSDKRLSYEPSARRVTVSHMTHPDTEDVAEIFRFHEELCELERHALGRLGEVQEGHWRQHPDGRERKESRGDLWKHFQVYYRNLYEEWDVLLKERDRQATKLIERMAAQIRHMRPDLSVIALGPDADSERSEAVLHSVLTADGPDALTEALLPRLHTSPFWHERLEAA